MTQQFKDLGGFASSEPSWLRRWVTSIMFRRLSDPRRRRKRREAFEKRRARSGAPHRVEYFHQVEDPYSYLTAQLLQSLVDTYDIELVPHLVSGPPGANAPEPEMLLPYSECDCALVAPLYGLDFPQDRETPDADKISLANRILCTATEADFLQLANTVGQALWSRGMVHLETLADRLGMASPQEAEDAVATGSGRRRELGHYSGAMFYYGGEWYWGVDRLYHLENRLLALNLRRHGGRQLLAPRPAVEMGTRRDREGLMLEIYPSLRSPYSSIIFDKTIALAANTGVKLVVRPVLPMVMRGTPVTRIKGMYIAFDTAREAETLGLMWGNAWDPIGKPVREAFALYPWAQQQGKGTALLSAFMRLAFFERVNTATRKGMRKVVESAGLDWAEARGRLRDTDWQPLLEENRLALYEQGIWGVPSFRLLDRQGNTLVSAWGADRLWVVARAIQSELNRQQD